MNTANGWIRQWTDQWRPAVRSAAQITALFTQALLERLDALVDLVQERTRTRQYVYSTTIRVTPDTREIEVPVGENWKLQLLTVSAAVKLYIRSGGILRYAQEFAAASSASPMTPISAGPGAPLTLTLDGVVDTEVTMQIEITEMSDPQNAIGAGERRPIGLPSNTVSTEIERHFPGTLETEAEDYHYDSTQA